MLARHPHGFSRASIRRMSEFSPTITVLEKAKMPGKATFKIGQDADRRRLDHVAAEAVEVAGPGAAGIDEGGDAAAARQKLGLDAERRAAPIDMGVQVDQPGETILPVTSRTSLPESRRRSRRPCRWRRRCRQPCRDPVPGRSRGRLSIPDRSLPRLIASASWSSPALRRRGSETLFEAEPVGHQAQLFPQRAGHVPASLTRLQMGGVHQQASNWRGRP